MFKGITNFFNGNTSIAKDCTCGQQASGVCTVRIGVSLTGVMSQKSSGLVRCGKFKEQLDAASRMVANQIKRTDAEP